MPAANRDQQRALYAKFGSAWVHRHHFDKIRGKRKRKRKGRSARESFARYRRGER